MRNLLRKIVQILDGTPAVYGRRTSGQSLVELALITPILIILIMGLVEIGWFSNNYLILLEVSRSGARRGTTLTGDLGPTTVWNYAASVHYDLVPDGTPEDAAARQYRTCPPPTQYSGFYNAVACLMVQSLDPLTLSICQPRDLTVCKDDLVVSVFSIQAINQTGPPTVTLTSPPPGAPGTGTVMVVVGRWPHNANECGYNAAGAVSPQEPRDPFDFTTNQNDDETWYPTYGDTAPERQRGFDYLLQHTLWDNPSCYGSEWTTQEVEQLINLPNFGVMNFAQRAALPSQGLILVEIFWQHELLLKNPVFNPVFNMLGSRTMISVWAAFPVPAAEPRLRFD